MVRNNELPDVGNTAKTVAQFVRMQIEEKGFSQEEIGEVIGRTQSYASLRIKGLKPWSVDELDVLSKTLGYKDAFELIKKAHKTMENGDLVSALAKKVNAGDTFGVAASKDPNKEQEAEGGDGR